MHLGGFSVTKENVLNTMYCHGREGDWDQQINASVIFNQNFPLVNVIIIDKSKKIFASPAAALLFMGIE